MKKWNFGKSYCVGAEKTTPPWMIIGDMNEVAWQHEKDGGNGWNSSRRRFLVEFMNSSNLVDLGFKGQSFTWQRCCEEDVTIRERLDRAIVNPEWLEFWQNTCVTQCAKIGSDHCPLVLECNPSLRRKGKVFRFEARWLNENECAEIVNSCWHLGGSGTNVGKWSRNLNSCKSDLLKWNKIRFPNCKLIIKELILEIDELQKVNIPEICVPKERALKAELDQTWR
ncbi:hypothetical protein CerSpe_009420 [Prunus speciosa]